MNTGPFNALKKPLAKLIFMNNRSTCVLIVTVLSLVLFASRADGNEFGKKSSISEYLSSAENGDPIAQVILGLMYSVGDGVPVDDSKAVYWLTKAAEQGLLDAQVHLADRYEQGKGVKANLTLAEKWYRSAATKGDKIAQHKLAYLLAQSPQSDSKEIIHWYTLAAEQGVPESQAALSMIFYEDDIVKSTQWLIKAAESGMVSAQHNVGSRYFFGRGVPVDKVRALFWYLKSAEAGLAESQLMLGKMYAVGNGVAKDEQIAFTWYSKAAKQGEPQAMHNLGLMYYQGKIVPKDEIQAYALWNVAAPDFEPSAKNRDILERGFSSQERLAGQTRSREFQLSIARINPASLDSTKSQSSPVAILDQRKSELPKTSIQREFQLLLKEAENGDPNAQAKIGKAYAFGEGIDQDWKMAVKWWSKASDAGHAGAQYGLGMCYSDGAGVEKSESTAFIWFLRAAESGDAAGQYKVAYAYATGNGASKNISEANRWFAKSARQGFAMSQIFIGINYKLGIGVQRDLIESYAWLAIAAEREEVAQEQLGKLLPIMSEADIQRAKARVLILKGEINK